ncbi:MAG: PBP1A family penicillin-binding protein [Eubacterium sp.]|nr:PBP1A family penicillin-binding protein [Eubacterium sp.]
MARVKKHRKFWFGFKVFILIFLILILFGGAFLYFKYGRDVFKIQEDARALVQASTAETFRSSETTLAYNKKGKQIAVLKGDKDAYFLSIDRIPQYVKDAFIVTEDKKFYKHNGIDGKGIARAVVALVKNKGEKKQGASTITQQLARGVFLTTDKTYERKIKEIFIALELEKKYSKDQILEYYLNTINFANGYYGIEAAAKGYFSKSCEELSLGQLTFLCSIPNNPTLYDPIDNYDNTVSRKNRILDQMLSDGVINQVEYDEAYNEKIELKIQEVTKRNYIQTYITYCATKALMKENGFTFKYEFDSDAEETAYKTEYNEAYATAQQMLLNNGYRIYTSIDLKKQKKLQKAVNSQLSGFKSKSKDGTYQMQGSAVCIDNKTGRVVAIVGGRSQKTEGYSLNRAYQSFRQPGSSIKPLIVYTPTLERGSTASTTVHDYKFSGGPSNSSGRYYGYVSLRYAVEQSLNTVAWQLFQKLTPEVGLDYLLKMQFSKIVKSDYYLPSSLGGLTYGASTVEMASAYATLENNGKYREPTCIIKILDSEGNVVVNDKVKEKYIYNADAANSMVDIMEGVITRGTARGLGLDNGMPSAAKTGTTNDKKDGWFCGFTPYYTTAVWVGYDTPKTVDDLYGSTYPGRIWNQFMNAIHSSLEVKNFDFEGKASSSGSSSGSYSSSGSSGQSSDSGSGGSTSDVDKDADDTNDSVDKDADDDNNVDATAAPATEAPATQPPATEAPATQEPVATQPPADEPDTVPEDQ